MYTHVLCVHIYIYSYNVRIHAYTHEQTAGHRYTHIIIDRHVGIYIRHTTETNQQITHFCVCNRDGEKSIIHIQCIYNIMILMELILTEFFFC